MRPSADQDANFDGALSQTFSGFNDWANIRLDQISANGLGGGTEDFMLVSSAADDLISFGGDDLVSFGGDDLVSLGGDDLISLGGDDLLVLAATTCSSGRRR